MRLRRLLSIGVGLLFAAACAVSRTDPAAGPRDHSSLEDEDPDADDIDAATAPLGWRPLRRVRRVGGAREIRIVEPSWSMVFRPNAVLRLRQRGTTIEGAYGLAWRTELERRSTRPYSPFNRDTLHARGCTHLRIAAEYTGCQVAGAAYPGWAEILAELDSIDAWNDPDPLIIERTPSGGFVTRGGFSGGCTDVPFLYIEVLVGSDYRNYRVADCGNAAQVARVDALFRVLRRVRQEAIAERPANAPTAEPVVAADSQP